MNTSSNSRHIRWAVTALATFLLTALTVMPSGAAPAGGSSVGRGGDPTVQGGQGSNPQAPYTLQGDTQNPTGTDRTGLFTTFANTTCAWCLGATNTLTGAVALTGHMDSSTSGVGVRGWGLGNGLQGIQAECCSGFPSAVGGGVFGYSNVASSQGVFGEDNNGSGAYGVWGVSSTGYGVVGNGGHTGVYGSASVASGGNSYGVYGSNVLTGTGAVGVYGNATSGRGVVGNSTAGIALLGASTNGSGFYGFSTNGPGGVLASGSSNGVAAYSLNTAPGNYAIVTLGDATHNGNVYITGRVTATGGCCASAQTNQGDRQMYAVESTQNVFSDQGTATLKDGKAIIAIDPLYAQTVDLAAGYQVFLTPGSADTAGLAVVNKTATSFEVRELQRGHGTFSFDWRIDGLQKGHTTERMAPAAPPPAALPAELASPPSVSVPEASPRGKGTTNK